MSSKADPTAWGELREANSGALSVLYYRHADAAYTFAFRRTASRSAAEDVVRATFATVWRRARAGSLEPLRLPSARPMLLAIAAREASDLRRGQRRPLALVDQVAHVGDSPDDAAEIAARLDDERRMSEVRRALDRLPRSQREAIELVTWAELSIDEAAAALGVTSWTMKSRLSRGRQHLTALFTPLARTAAGEPFVSIHPPPAGRLPAERRDAILHDVLAGDSPASPGRSRWAVPALAAAAVIAVVAAGALGQSLRPTGTPEGEGPEVPGIRRTVPFDRGPLSSERLAEQVERCLVGQSRPSNYRVEYARMVDAPHGPPVSALVLTSRDAGVTDTCVGGTLSTATADAALEPDEGHPVVVADSGGDVVSTDPDNSTVMSWFTERWYRVSPEVAWVATRVGTQDGNEPWRVSPARDGWVYAATWWTGARYDADDEVSVESVAYDAQGRVIDTGEVLAPRLVDTDAA